MSSPSSLSVGVVRVTDQNRKELMGMVGGMYEAERCGVCEKTGAEVFWFSPVSRCAHSVCYGTIKNIEADLIAKINTIFKDTGHRNVAHARAIRAVREELGGVSIKTFLETNGAEQLKSIFDSSGLKAILTFASKL